MSKIFLSMRNFRRIIILTSIGFLAYFLLFASGRHLFAGNPAQLPLLQPEPAPKNLAAMSPAELDTLIRTLHRNQPEVVQRLYAYTELALGTPYSLFCLGEGPEGKYDQDPLIDFTRVDCVTFCEQSLALAISQNYAEMFRNLQRIRYRDGIIDFRTRNHFTHADWLPNNRWLLYDATVEIGGDRAAEMTKTIDRPQLFKKLGVPEDELSEIPAAAEMTIKYIPAQALPAIQDRLQGGEIVSIVQNKPGIFAAHTGLIVRKPSGEILMRHASSKAEVNQVVDESFADIVAQIAASQTRVGMAFFRIQTDWVKNLSD